ncbi:hypothetical protein BKA70DRAFT_1218010 [Coprinopsis sp. MPI-PUGE-AT-0042]|nr:hypothetical protein BKA70DRAFT_1218010 [Coprinopsis sp. MPI-PUGE-AT-0042]
MSQLNSTEAVTSVTGSSQTSSPPGRSNDDSAWRAKPISGQPTITKPRSLSNPAVVSGGGDRQGTSQGNARTYQANPQSGSASLTQSSAAASLSPPTGKNSSSSGPTSVTRPPAIAVHHPAHLGSSLPSSSTPITAATAGHSTPTGSLRVDVTSLSTKGPPAPPPKSPRHNPNFLRSLSADTIPPLPTTMGSGQSKATPPAAPLSEPTRQRHPHSLQAEKQPQGNLASTPSAPRNATLSPQPDQPSRRSPSPSPRAAPSSAPQSLSPTPAILTSAVSQAPSSNGQPSTPTSSGSFGSGASKLMRKFAGRRKKSEDATTLFAKIGQGSDGDGHVRNGSRSRLDISVAGPRGPASPPMSSQSAGSQQPKYSPMPLVSSPPPISPPTARKPSPIPIPPAMISAVVEPVAGSVQELTVPANRDRASVIAVSPGMTSALNFMRTLPEAKGTETHAEGVPGPVNPRIPPSSAPASSGSLPASPVTENEDSREGQTSNELKEIWRKSDSTIGHHTLRQGAGSARNSRPVSMAESFQSAFTVVPGVSAGGNKRWSTLTADMEIGVMVEEDGEDTEEAFHLVKQSPPASSSARTSPVLSAKQQKRRSVSLNLGALSSAAAQVAPSLVHASGKPHYGQEVTPLCYSASDSGAMPTPRPSYPSTAVPPGDNVRSTIYQQERSLNGPQPVATNGGSWRSHSSNGQDPRQQSNQSLDQAPSSATNLRQRFPGWPSSRNAGPPPSAMPPLSNSAFSHGPAPGPRAPTISLTNSLAPAAGLAKQAAKKLGGIGKKWVLSNTSSSSGQSSSASNREAAAQAQADHGQGVPLGRTNSNQSSLASSMKSGATSLSSFGEIVHRVQLPSRSKDKRNRRTPNAPSGAYSTSSVTSTSTSESDAFFTSSGPMLGVMVRGPIKTKQGTLISGVVFGQDLKTAVEQTMPITVSNLDKDADSKVGGERERLVKEVQTRMLPALVTRCAQHLLIWGVQEEGLFRVSGRASHITRLRTEFDTGVDYDMTSCHPGDLDPHAVASVFKAYLRELPEAILTNSLHPLFEAAVARELETNPSAAMTSKVGTRQPGLPSSPKANMTTPIRKPPSLSTLAMPSFSGMPAASSVLVRNLRSLISRLPQENRDLIRTIVQLMRATYHASKETKMPLSNLLLVFCPSLNMTPPLLKALCECEEIWSPPSSESTDAVMEIKRETVVLDIKPTEYEQDLRPKEQHEDPETPSVQNPPVVQSPPLEQPAAEQPVENPSVPFESFPSRPPVPTIYLDTESHLSSSSLSSVQEIEARYDASMPSPPPLSSSAESVVTPTSSTGHPSIHHLPISDGDAKGKLSRKSSVNDLLRPDDGAQVVHRLDSPRRMNSEVTGNGQGPVEFPSSPPLPTAQKRRSLALLSLSGFSAMSPASSGSQDSEERGLRGNKPSLRRLFTKRSTASLVSNHSGAARSSNPPQHSPGALAFTPSTPRTASSSTVSTPISAVTAPQYSASMLPPVLDMHIDTGTSLSFDLGFDVDDSSDDLHSQFTPSQAESVIYASAVTSQVSLFAQDEPKHPYGRGRSESTASVASSNHLGYEDSQEDEDWMKTVLAAACGDKI